MKFTTALPVGVSARTQHVPLDIVSDTVAVSAAEFSDQHDSLREKVTAIKEMADDMLNYLDSVQNAVDTRTATLPELRKNDNIKPIDSRRFLQFVATLSHATDVTRDAFYESIAVGYGLYLIPLYVLENVADRNRVTLSRTVLPNVNRIDDRKYLRAHGWREEKIPDFLDDVREHYGASGGRSWMSRERASRDNTAVKDTSGKNDTTAIMNHEHIEEMKNTMEQGGQQ